jgi:cytochrome c556
MAVVLVAMAAAQSKIMTAEDYSKVMKTTAQAFIATNKAIGSGAFADARTQLATARQGFTTIHAFWVEKQKSDAAGIAKEALTNLDALDKVLSAPTVDQAAAQAAAKQVQGACGSCHKLYREGDGKQTPYSIKAGVL